MGEETIKDIEKGVEDYVVGLFHTHQKPELLYHNLAHTQSVASHAVEIGKALGLVADQLFILFVAGWFHDTGHLFGPGLGHEAVGVRVLWDYFSDHPTLPMQTIATIEACIMATQMPQTPHTRLEEILCDADTYHLGTDMFEHTNELVREETLLRGGKVDDWDTQTIKMLQQHRFHTRYCRQKLDAGKLRNIEMLQCRE